MNKELKILLTLFKYIIILKSSRTRKKNEVKREFKKEDTPYLQIKDEKEVHEP